MSDLRLELQSFTKNVCDGFVRFQQNGDFVDMTLAAEGHLVKVHKNIMSVSSPYIEALLKSIPCEHPVIFLNNVTHQTLGYILEYVYMGVVIVPKDKIDQFALACKQLQIVGLMEYEDAMHDASVKLNKSKKGIKDQIHSTVSKHRSTKTSFYYDTKSNRYEEINHNTDPTLEEESCRNTVPLSITHVNKTITNVESNVTYMDRNITDVDKNFINDDRNIIDLDRNLTHVDGDIRNMASDNQNNVFIETKKLKSSSISTGPSAAKQIKLCIVSHTNTISDPVNNNSINNNTDQPKYQIDLSNIRTVKDILNCNDSEKSDTGIFTPDVSEPVGVISNVDDPTPSHSNIAVVKNTNSVRPMASLILNPVDGTINITQNNEINTDMENYKLVTNVVEEPNGHTDTSNDYDFTNWIQVNNDGNSVAINDLKKPSENSLDIATKKITKVTAKTLVFDKNTKLLVPIGQSSETIDTGDSNVTRFDNYQDQFQHHLGIQNNSGSSYLEYRSKILEDAKPLYTLSNRGALQMILNRFTYGIHYASSSMKKRRWRCIQYRDLHCPATVDTLDEDIIKRSFEHTHPFHDSKIIRKGQKDAVFAKMSQALKYAKALQKEIASIRNQEDYKRDLAMLIVKEDELNCISKDEI